MLDVSLVVPKPFKLLWQRRCSTAWAAGPFLCVALYPFLRRCQHGGWQLDFLSGLHPGFLFWLCLGWAWMNREQMLTVWSPRHPLRPAHPPALPGWTRALCDISHATCSPSARLLRGALLSFCSLLTVCQILFKLNLMAKTPSKLQRSIIKSVCILVGFFFQIALVVLKSTLFDLQSQGHLPSSNQEKTAYPSATTATKSLPPLPTNHLLRQH